MMGTGELMIEPLITHVITPSEAQATFETMLRGNDAWLGIVIKWE
jgi:threonine dehydrogenase-like Zn-dependent dehydrogenase